MSACHVHHPDAPHTPAARAAPVAARRGALLVAGCPHWQARDMTPDAEPHDLAAMNPTGRFTDRAADYVKYRPDYPTAAFDAVLGGLGDPARVHAVDVGAGTGIS